MRKTAPSAASAVETRSHVSRGSAALHKSAKLLKEYWDAIPQVKLTHEYIRHQETSLQVQCV